MFALSLREVIFHGLLVWYVLFAGGLIAWTVVEGRKVSRAGRGMIRDGSVPPVQGDDDDHRSPG